MAIVVYYSGKDADEQRLLEMISFTDTDVCRSVDELRRHLNVPGDMRKIIILCMKDHAEIIRIAKLLELYSDLLIIVILYSNDPETIRAAHNLRPRYIAYRADDFQDVAVVLQKIIHYCGLSAKDGSL